MCSIFEIVIIYLILEAVLWCCWLGHGHCFTNPTGSFFVFFWVTLESSAAWTKASYSAILFLSTSVQTLRLDWYRVSADTHQYWWVSVSTDTCVSISTDTSCPAIFYRFFYLSQHCCMHAYSLPYSKYLQQCWQQLVGCGLARDCCR